ncbi:MAG TPA: DUF6657 family protein [Rectinemataceae bacterium]|nr:DUF6657 family protein [Rectinemataceae bacterium]
MAQIKSALELALERTKDLKVDQASLEANELKQEGKRSAGRYLEEPATMDLKKKLDSYPKDKRAFVKIGMHDILSAQIQLPTNDSGLEKLGAIASAYAVIAGDGGMIGGVLAEKRVQGLFQQLEAFLRKYLEDMRNVDQVIKQQWAPKLREKERAMAARLGQEVRLDPMMDQEFSAFYKQNVGAVREQYQAALDKAREDLAAMAGVAQD